MSSGLGPNPANHPRGPEPKKHTRDLGIVWVPKFNGDPGIKANTSQQPSGFAINPKTDDIVKGSEYVGSRLRQYWIVTRENRVMKVDPETHQILWSRWSV